MSGNPDPVSLPLEELWAVQISINGEWDWYPDGLKPVMAMTRDDAESFAERGAFYRRAEFRVVPYREVPEELRDKRRIAPPAPLPGES